MTTGSGKISPDSIYMAVTNDRYAAFTKATGHGETYHRRDGKLLVSL